MIMVSGCLCGCIVWSICVVCLRCVVLFVVFNMHIHVDDLIYIYIYIYREREIIPICVCVYIYIYIYIYQHFYELLDNEPAAALLRVQEGELHPGRDVRDLGRRQTCHFRKHAASAPAEWPAHGLDSATHGEFDLRTLQAPTSTNVTLLRSRSSQGKLTTSRGIEPIHSLS